MDLLYTAAATARGGREGEVVSDDGVLDLDLAMPEELGGPGGDKSNPEQLFAAGTRPASTPRSSGSPASRRSTSRALRSRRRSASGSTTRASASPRRSPALPDARRRAGRALMDAAHQVCPYSRATRGNVEVVLAVG
jgi:organic hydroperoxide reductase OsmC/OhrA